MKTLFCLFITMTALGVNAAIAAPITANSGASFYFDMRIAGGGTLPAGLESISGPPSHSYTSNSLLQSNDAAEVNGTDALINGLSPETPSIFSSWSSSTRNGGAEGASSTNSTSLYQIFSTESQPDGSNDVSERGIWGSGLAQATLNSEIFPTQAVSEVSFARQFTLANQSDDTLTFGIEGRFEMDLFAYTDGEGVAETFANFGLFFSSANILDILFSDTSPYINNQTESGTQSSVSIGRQTDVVNSGYLSLFGNASASGLNAGGVQQGFGNSAMSYVLGITLQPGEEITMLQFVDYSNFAEIGAVVDVSEPDSLLLMLASLCLLFANRYPFKRTPGRPMQ